MGGNTNIMAEPNTAPERDPTFPMSIVHQDSIDMKGKKRSVRILSLFYYCLPLIFDARTPMQVNSKADMLK